MCRSGDDKALNFAKLREAREAEKARAEAAEAHAADLREQLRRAEVMVEFVSGGFDRATAERLASTSVTPDAARMVTEAVQ